MKTPPHKAIPVQVIGLFGYLVEILCEDRSLGKDGISKSDEFLEKFQKGGEGGSFPIQKFILQILDLQIGSFQSNTILSPFYPFLFYSAS